MHIIQCLYIEKYKYVFKQPSNRARPCSASRFLKQSTTPIINRLENHMSTPPAACLVLQCILYLYTGTYFEAKWKILFSLAAYRGLKMQKWCNISFVCKGGCTNTSKAKKFTALRQTMRLPRFALFFWILKPLRCGVLYTYY